MLCLKNFATPAAIVAAIAVATAARGDEILLRYKFEEGQQFVTQMEQNVDISMNVAGGGGPQQMKMDMSQIFEMGMDIEEVDPEGVARIEFDVRRVAMKMDNPLAPQASFEYDTAGEAELQGPLAQLASMLDSMLDMSFEMRLGPTGETVEVVELEVPDQIKNAAGLPGAGKMFDPEQMGKQSGLALLPTEAVEKGDTWTQELEMPNPAGGTVTSEVTYTYDGTVQRDGESLQKITMAGDIDMKFPQLPQGTTLEVKSAKMTGTLYFDNEAGRMTVSETEMAMKAVISAGGQTINQDIDMQQNARIVPADEFEAESEASQGTE